MLLENENLVEGSTENVEQLTTEEMVEEEVVEEVDTPEEEVEEIDEQPKGKFYTDEDIKKLKMRVKDRTKRDIEKKYSRLETVVNTGLGTSTVEESTQKLEEFYRQKGIEIPSAPTYTERETEILAQGEANDIIEAGFDEVVEEVDRLASIGVENMSPRDKIIFHKLATYRQAQEQEQDLRSIGVSKDEIESEEFKEFTNKLNPNLSLKEKYEMYSSMKPKKTNKTNREC